MVPLLNTEAWRKNNRNKTVVFTSVHDTQEANTGILESILARGKKSKIKNAFCTAKSDKNETSRRNEMLQKVLYRTQSSFPKASEVKMNAFLMKMY